MIINREFTETHDFDLLIICQIEKEIERIISAAYNNKQVDVVAKKSGGRQE
ncbi:hypothetical protein U8Y98_00765 [Priestia megaterium]|uniref:hypothetical protein n=1 Tax=Priestia megaterium TaxID=1404 RepID=UPI002FE2B5BE